MTDHASGLAPAEFGRRALQALEASEGRRKRRKRDQTPDRLGLALKRELLERAIAENPAAEAFEAWLLAQALSAPASGPVRAMCLSIMDEYRLAALDPNFERWLAEGAPSDDAANGARKDETVARVRHERSPN